MKFTADKTELLQALTPCLSCADGRSPQPILATVLIEAGAKTVRFSATDLMRSVTSVGDAEVATAGSICLPAKDLHERLKLLSDGQVTVDAEGTKVTLKTKGSARRFVMRSANPEDFPRVRASGWTESLKTTTHAMACLVTAVQHAISTDSSRPTLNALCLQSGGGGLRATATDGHRVASASNGEDANGAEWLIPLPAVGDLRKLCDTKANVDLVAGESNGTLFVKVENVTYSCMLVAGQFLAWQNVLSQPERVITVPRKPLVEALRAVSVSAGQLKHGVRCTFDSGKLTLEAEAAEAGEALDQIEIDYAGKQLSIGLNFHYMLDALTVLASENVAIASGAVMDPIVIRSPDAPEQYLAVVMPMEM